MRMWRKHGCETFLAAKPVTGHNLRTLSAVAGDRLPARMGHKTTKKPNGLPARGFR